MRPSGVAFAQSGRQGVAVSAHSAILIDAETGAILYEKDAYTRRPMASTTKMMTAILAMERAKPTDAVTSKHASQTPYTGLYLKEGEKVSVQDLLWGCCCARQRCLRRAGRARRRL